MDDTSDCPSSSSDDSLRQELYELESRLHRPEVRSSAEQLATLLASVKSHRQGRVSDSIGGLI